ncbi:PEP-CTERM sorting domain-containing protein [Aliiglaciecola sp. LCG003]|uniref:PEP-CTERM sorting domain-containing protein n=1 Tax=Aliiglaciecola sp. LCG003 TaxID=3053655 RepID=UPI002573B3A3|nr:PEP-CTERM sorting domain-containing protein [Aliiglaciecola sp. LCG003]WJG09749.1 PEP-CTERM sorting domain-containing protein [Aliiglaciecola sp. LCG003]
MKTTIKGFKLLGLAALVVCWFPAQASLIGQNVDLALISVATPSSTPVFIAEDTLTNPLTVTVVEGVVEGAGFMDGFMNVDIEDDVLGVLFPGGVVVNGDAMSLNDALGLGPQTFIGLLFANLSWGIDNPGTLVGFENLQTNIAGFTNSNVLFDPTNIAFNIVDLVINPGSFVIVDLVVEHNSQVIPEPAMYALFLFGLMALRVSRKRVN